MAELSVLENYSSDSSSDSVSEEPVPKKSRGQEREYSKVKEFTSLSVALESIKAEKLWRSRFAYNTAGGRKHTFDCKFSRKCACKMLALCHPDSNMVSLYRTTDTHTHDPGKTRQGIPSQIQTRIMELFNSGVTKPKLILKNLRDAGVPEPKEQQLSNFLVYQRRKQGPAILSLGELEKYCREFSKVPEDDDEAYILSHVVEISENDSENYFRFIITSKRLQQVMEKSDTVHADATYKLLWNGFPVLITGVLDKSKAFHPFGIAVCSNEATDDFKFVFDAMKTGSSTGQYTPSVLVADCAEAITKACTAAFGENVTRVHCWAHVIRNLDKKLSTIPTEEVRKAIRNDICTLQLAQSSSEFEVASELWRKKWSADASANTFVQYFCTEYLNKFNGWFEGRAIGSPSTNNCLESTNNVIKKKWTLRERLSISCFLDVAKMEVREWSLKRNPNAVNCKLYAHIPPLPLKLQTEAYTWIRGKPKIMLRTQRDLKSYFITPSNMPPTKPTEVDTYLRSEQRKGWKSFDNYTKFRTKMWVVRIQSGNWKKSSCSCGAYLKDYVCKHIVGVAITEKYFEVVPEAKSIPIGEKRKRGRPAKAAKALLRQ